MRSKLINILIVVAAAMLWPSVVLAQNNTNAAAELMRAQREGRTTGMDQAGANPFSQQQYDENGDPIEEGEGEQEDSTKKERIRKPLESYFFSDSIRALNNFKWNIDPYANRVKIQPLDTILRDWRIDYPFLQEGVGDLYLGNLGGATTPLNYFERPQNFNFKMADAYDGYLMKMDNVDFYNAKHPFTQLFYTTAGQKSRQEDNFRVIHAQNISPSTNVNIDYKSRGTRGIYTWQRARVKDLSVAFAHTGRRYSVHAGYIYNAIDTRENGGIVGDWAIVDTMFELTTNVPVKLQDAKNKIRTNSFYVVQSFGIPLIGLTEDDFTMGDRPAVFIGHAFEYNRIYRKYTDTRSGTRFTDERDESGGMTQHEYYENWFIDPAQTVDSTFESRISNRVFVQIQPWDRNGVVGVIDAGVGLDNHRYYQFTMDDYLSGERKAVSKTSYYAYGSIDGRIKKYVDWGGDVKFYPSGYRGGDLEIGADIALRAFIKNRPIQLSGRFSNVLRSPSYFEENYFSNHYAWFTPLKKENETRFEVALTAPDYALEVGAWYGLSSDKIYIDSLCHINQSTSTVSVTGLYARKDFRIGGLHLDNRVLLQWSTDQKVIPVPKASVVLSYYYEFDIVKDVLRMQAGLEGRYNTKYYAFGYNPALAAFYNQREAKVGGYPMIDAFVSAKWKRMRIFVKLQHANYDLFGKRTYFSALHYPLNTRVLKLGFSWGFYD